MTPENCYSCTLPIVEGDEIATLEDEHGVRWIVHRRCLEKDFEASGEPRSVWEESDGTA